MNIAIEKRGWGGGESVNKDYTKEASRVCVRAASVHARVCVCECV